MTKHYARMAFFVHTVELTNHYKALWRCMRIDEFDVILHGSNSEKCETQVCVSAMGYHCVDSQDVIADGYQYEVLISNLSMHSHKSKPITKVLGRINIRFMYALGKARHNFAAWNAHYDLILCFGPWQAERVKSCCDAVTFEMGYPRYDDYFNSALCQTPFPLLTPLDPAKKTVLWLPTWLDLSSITAFSDVMGSLCDTYNVIVKTHPLMASREPEKIALLNHYRFHAVITHAVDNLALFRIANSVVCDYGGTAFGALYLDKPLLLLNLPEAAQDPLTGDDSPDILLRKDIVSLDIAQRWQLAELLADDALWQAQKATRLALRTRYFAPTYGFSAQVALLAIRNVRHILTQAGKELSEWSFG